MIETTSEDRSLAAKAKTRPVAHSLSGVRGWNWLFYLVSAAALLGGWQLLVTLGDYERFLLPGPADVWAQFRVVARDGRLWTHGLTTVSEIIPGLLIGALVALPLGYVLAKSPPAERLLSPYIVASQAIPIVAVAPLLAIWIDSVFWSRVLVAVLVVFFPILVSAIAGLRAVPPQLYDLMKSLRASRWQIFWKLELPAAMPTLIAGLKVGATLSVIGTIVGEFVQPKSIGLGFLINTARYQFKTDLVFVVLITLGVISLSMYGVISLLEKRLLRWRDLSTS